jgi:hypothetical protein
MNRITFVLAGAMIAASALSSDQTAEFKKFMMSMKPKVEMAFDHKDMKMFDQMSTKDFTETAMGHTMTKSQAMAEMKKEFATVKSVDCHLSLTSAKADKGTGTAFTTGHVVMMTMPDPKGKSHKVSVDMWEKQTWVKQGSTWKIKHLEQVKPPVTMMDGKPMQPMIKSKAG